jgi:hypothetical protein
MNGLIWEREMSIEAMKQAIEALKGYRLETNEAAIKALEQAIKQAEKQEPVAYMDYKGYICNHTTNPERWTPLYTAPPQREWINLTNDEIRQCDESIEANHYSIYSYSRMLEAKIKEKNYD